jgi:gas vesicle protein
MENENNIGNGMGWFLFGTVVGVTAAILLAPGSGKATRRKLAKQAARGRENFFNATQDAVEKGRELFERGREIAQEASEMFERGRRVAEKSFEERF